MVQVFVLNFDNKEHIAGEVVVIYIVAYKFKNLSRKVIRKELKNETQPSRFFVISFAKSECRNEIDRSWNVEFEI
ncbi:hypothetical protein CEXT_444551 [Caerostris extrusa]|uniref:Uncharacterized protein n=1 Tax=Caerostris extrusa TaxID=172846 RepID=A0AAV4QH95_CAEEX|nr:hypothetical protein CEXT_444551 [Caerostris extrusa]